MNQCPIFFTDNQWKKHLLWKHEHEKKRHSTYHPNRHYYRGPDPSNIADLPVIDTYSSAIDPPSLSPDCVKEMEQVGSGPSDIDVVTAYNNQYSNDTPPMDLDPMVFSVFNTRPVTKYDISMILNIYRKSRETPQAEQRFGPFDQTNINLAGLHPHNQDSWDEAWKAYGEPNQYRAPTTPQYNSPYLLKLGHDIARQYLLAINSSLWQLDVNDPNFHLAKNRIDQISRSTITGYLKYQVVVALTRNTTAKAYYFFINAYVGPEKNRGDRIPINPKIYLGQTRYLGWTTSDHILLPKGDQDIIHGSGADLGTKGRPLNPHYAKDSEIMSEHEIRDRFWNHLEKTRSFTPKYKFNDDIDNLPLWFDTRLRKKII